MIQPATVLGAAWIQPSNKTEKCKIHDPYIDSTETVEWSGNCRKGYANGEGTATFSGSGREIYVGDFKMGKRTGKGISSRGNGTIRYEGGWKNGLYHGQGIYSHCIPGLECARSVGEFKDDNMWEGTDDNGEGTITYYKNGNKVPNGQYARNQQSSSGGGYRITQKYMDKDPMEIYGECSDGTRLSGHRNSSDAYWTINGKTWVQKENYSLEEALSAACR